MFKEIYFAEFKKSYYLKGLQKLEYNFVSKCIELKTVHIENNTNKTNRDIFFIFFQFVHGLH